MLQLAIGGIAGILSGVFGIGGGVVIVPALILMLRMPPQTATGTSLAALLLPVGLLGAWQYYKSGAVDVRAAALVAVGLMAGAWLGARIGLSLPPRVMERAFAVFLVLVAAQMWWKA
ncbi:MAG: sulfite exporter TauE/SafE family protein [Candidatus Eisenbacteria bacterium]|uniref:Probable membrane transporter protein n=1 Tax=Eiseniibacteriota bacterium TaxID=2212470 RepID=A0A9D6L604_UNCEI|nr:sulfite exporter TauE/SafE family protein [Candidatus Eisenbacteria bacterium]MBI3539548.1 sulfite exporter TauE/SafE family protein [Candidatus Eisenbacteria bacterium]